MNVVMVFLHRDQLQETLQKPWLANKFPKGSTKGTYSCVLQGSKWDSVMAALEISISAHGRKLGSVLI